MKARTSRRPLAAIIAKAKNAENAMRYADATSMRNDVLRHLDGEPVSVYRESLVERIGRWSARNRVLLALVAAYLLMRAIVFLWFRL